MMFIRPAYGHYTAIPNSN
jgi:hypothetical protein